MRALATFITWASMAAVFNLEGGFTAVGACAYVVMVAAAFYGGILFATWLSERGIW